VLYFTKFILRVYSYFLLISKRKYYIEDVVLRCEKEFPAFYKVFFRIAVAIIILSTFAVVSSFFYSGIDVTQQKALQMGGAYYISYGILKSLALYYEFGTLFSVATIFYADCYLFNMRKELFLSNINDGSIVEGNVIFIFQQRFVGLLYDCEKRWKLSFLFALTVSLLSLIACFLISCSPKYTNFFWTLWLTLDACIVYCLLYAASTVTKSFQDISNFIYSECCMKRAWSDIILDAIDPVRHKLGFKLLDGRPLTRTWLAVWILTIFSSMSILVKYIELFVNDQQKPINNNLNLL